MDQAETTPITTPPPAAGAELRRWVDPLEGWHRLAREGRNPLYAWHAMIWCFGHDQPLPGWVLNYLRDVAIDIHRIIDEVLRDAPVNGAGVAAARAIEQVPAALMFTRKGRNAFAALAEDYALMGDEGIATRAEVNNPHTPAAGTTAVAARRNVSERQARNRRRDAQRLLGLTTR